MHKLALALIALGSFVTVAHATTLTKEQYAQAKAQVQKNQHATEMRGNRLAGNYKGGLESELHKVDALGKGKVMITGNVNMDSPTKMLVRAPQGAIKRAPLSNDAFPPKAAMFTKTEANAILKSTKAQNAGYYFSTEPVSDVTTRVWTQLTMKQQGDLGLKGPSIY